MRYINIGMEIIGCVVFLFSKPHFALIFLLHFAKNTLYTNRNIFATFSIYNLLTSSGQQSQRVVHRWSTSHRFCPTSSSCAQSPRGAICGGSVRPQTKWIRKATRGERRNSLECISIAAFPWSSLHWSRDSCPWNDMNTRYPYCFGNWKWRLLQSHNEIS